MSFGRGYFSLGKKVPLGRISRLEFLIHRQTPDRHQTDDSLIISA